MTNTPQGDIREKLLTAKSGVPVLAGHVFGYIVNILHTPYSPQVQAPSSAKVASAKAIDGETVENKPVSTNKISLKTKTMNNSKQKINDLLGNPIIVDTMVIWRIVDTAKAMFCVDNYVVLCGNKEAAPVVNSGFLY